LRRNWPLVMIVGAIVVVNLLGLEYYLKPIEERVRDPQHAWLKPSGYVGQSAGLIAFALFLFLYLYPLRKGSAGSSSSEDSTAGSTCTSLRDSSSPRSVRCTPRGVSRASSDGVTSRW